MALRRKDQRSGVTVQNGVFHAITPITRERIADIRCLREEYLSEDRDTASSPEIRFGIEEVLPMPKVCTVTVQG
jgi:hypothetical protein